MQSPAYRTGREPLARSVLNNFANAKTIRLNRLVSTFYATRTFRWPFLLSTRSKFFAAATHLAAHDW